MNYEENVAKLQEIIIDMQKENLPMDKAVDLFKEGADILKKCEEYLEKTKGNVYKIRQDMESYKEEKMN